MTFMIFICFLIFIIKFLLTHSVLYDMLILEVIYMKSNIFSRVLTLKTAKSLAQVMSLFCGFIVFFVIVTILLAAVGRQTFTLHSPSGTFTHTFYAQKDRNAATNLLMVSLPDDVRITTDHTDEIDIVTVIGLLAALLVNHLPVLFSYLFLMRIFQNIGKGVFFVDANAKALLLYGLIQACAAVFGPFVKLFVIHVTDFLSANTVSIATGGQMLSQLTPAIAVIIAACILHYGIHLQDEVDHTL